MASSQAEGAVSHGWDLPTSWGQLLKAAVRQTKAFWLHLTVEHEGVTYSDGNDSELDCHLFLERKGIRNFPREKEGKRKKSQINSQSEHLNQMTELL